MTIMKEKCDYIERMKDRQTDKNKLTLKQRERVTFRERIIHDHIKRVG